MRAGLLACALLAAAPGVGAADGEALFAQHCAACHQTNGGGTPGLAPALAGTLGARATKPAGRDYLVQVLLSGLNGPITSQGQPFNGFMPAFTQLPDAELAAVLNHVLGEFNGATLAAGHVPLSEGELAAARRGKRSPGAVRNSRAMSD
jgi:mono/diheme cytochrome c family protein